MEKTQKPDASSAVIVTMVRSESLLYTPPFMSGSKPSFCISVLVLGILFFATILIGAINIHDCKGQTFIPIFLIVIGLLDMFAYLPIRLWPQSQTSAPRLANICHWMTALFICGWLIAGSIWVFGLSADYENSESPNYCHPTPYVAAFVAIVLNWIAVATDIVSPILYLFGRQD